VSVVPDKVSPEIGWRVWVVYSHTSLGRARLESLTQRVIWQPGVPATARCNTRLADIWFTSPHFPHPAPHPRCSCGIFASDSIDWLFRRYNRHLTESLVSWAPRVLGKVQLWGKVVPGSCGWRAEFAYPVELFILKDSRLAGYWKRRSLRAYGVPVHSISDFREAT
jgi:hypothetical protein